jgi:hypothetical protein
MPEAQKYPTGSRYAKNQMKELYIYTCIRDCTYTKEKKQEMVIRKNSEDIKQKKKRRRK